MCPACRFCFSVYLDLSPLGIVSSYAALKALTRACSDPSSRAKCAVGAGVIGPAATESRLTLRHLELHLLEAFQGHAALDTENFNAHDVVLLVKIENDIRLNLLGTYDLGVVQANVNGIGFLVEMNFHGVFLCRRHPAQAL